MNSKYSKRALKQMTDITVSCKNNYIFIKRMNIFSIMHIIFLKSTYFLKPTIFRFSKIMNRQRILVLKFILQNNFESL